MQAFYRFLNDPLNEENCLKNFGFTLILAKTFTGEVRSINLEDEKKILDANNEMANQAL